VWGHFAPEIEEVVGSTKFNQMSAQFARGMLDRDLAAQVKLRNEGLLLEHFSFMQSHMQVSQEAEQLFKVRLQAEQTLWSQHVSRVHEWHTRTHEAKHDAALQIHNMRVEMVDAHCTESFPTSLVSQVKEAPHTLRVQPLIGARDAGQAHVRGQL